MTVYPTAPTNPALAEQLHSLGQHLLQCRQAQARWFNTAQLAERAHGLVGPRFITTVAGVAVLLALCNGWA